jgi:hypothetical protein
MLCALPLFYFQVPYFFLFWNSDHFWRSSSVVLLLIKLSMNHPSRHTQELFSLKSTSLLEVTTELH